MVPTLHTETEKTLGLYMHRRPQEKYFVCFSVM